MADDVCARLSRLDACAVSDALDQLGLPPSITGLAALSVRQRIAGRVTTVRLAAGRPPEGARPRHLCTAAIDAAEPGGVIVVEHRSGVECAGWGGILSNAASLRGLSGVIVDGLARDVDEARDIGFPVYARGATARTARGRVFEAETGGTVRVGAVEVGQGDFVVADSSGTAFVPADRIGDVLAAAERIAAKEAAMTREVLAGKPVSGVMGASYEHLLDRGDA
ncbi:RraA family protein [Rhizorhabdus wittichii]|uniref:RraA family protein n=1 Tax=Rhizorhabdus wittichii TaxID=160791 RepID=UPI000304C347|nr:dimethylmenaquinone methyltransferase [Rhizorhabdus wittichii]